MDISNYCKKIFASNQVKEIDKYTIKNEPIASIDLMERAADAIFRFIADKYSCGEDVLRNYAIFCGPGNNGGDGLALTRIMNRYGFGAVAYCLCDFEKLSPDSKTNYDRLKQIGNPDIVNLINIEDFPSLAENTIIIDCIFGSGLTRPVDGYYADIINIINNLPNITVAIDIPSGLYGENNTTNTGAIVNADYTLTLQFPFLSMMFAENHKYTGDVESIEIGLHDTAIKETETDYYLVSNTLIHEILVKRSRFDHKGIFGHAMLIAGSYGKAGAAILAAKSCLRSGVGLLTCHVPRENNSILQISIPEAMTSVDNNSELISEFPEMHQFDAFGIGPGLGSSDITKDAFLSFLKKCKKPLVIDADGLNLLSTVKDFENLVPENSILTPHPGEFKRLFGETKNTYETISVMQKVSREHKIIIIYKSGISIISLPDGKVFFNTAGNPGMATAGSGDVLTGLILSLLAQNYKAEFSAIAGVFIHSLAGDLAKEKYGEVGMIAGDIIEFIPNVFKAISYDEKPKA